MDDMSSNKSNAYERSEEEVSWDAEFANMDQPRESGYPRMLTDLGKLAMQVPVAMVRMPMEILPSDTARHARAAAREGFLAVRSLLGAIADGIENMLSEPSERKATVAGPAGTWGSARHSSSGTSSTPPGKARRIEVSDEISERTSEGQGTITIDDLGEQEGRGLRADIDY
jgi:hypothetical protein